MNVCMKLFFPGYCSSYSLVKIKINYLQKYEHAFETDAIVALF